jgi:hypothetical protein
MEQQLAWRTAGSRLSLIRAMFYKTVRNATSEIKEAIRNGN